MTAVLCVIFGVWAWMMALTGQVDGPLAYAFAIAGGLLLAYPLSRLVTELRS